METKTYDQYFAEAESEVCDELGFPEMPIALKNENSVKIVWTLLVRSRMEEKRLVLRLQEEREANSALIERQQTEH